MSPQRHAVIAGTGRAGTTFLVDFLRAVGVPTDGLDDSATNERARAGLEKPLSHAVQSYLVKDPWLHEYLAEVDLDTLSIDALIVPVRSLTAAAMSRVRLERAAMRDELPWWSSWSTFGRTPGGVVYSLNVSDQENVLAVGQARLIDWALQHDLPLYLLSYPRLIHDPEYLVDCLWTWLSQFCDRQTAVRIAREKSSPRTWESDDREVDELVPRDHHLSVVSQKESLELHLAEKREELDRVQRVVTELNRQLNERSDTIEVLSQRIAHLQHERAVAGERIQQLRETDSSLRAELEDLRNARSYRLALRIAAPLRKIRMVVGQGRTQG